MLEHIYNSLNDAIKAQWLAIAPTVPVVIGHPGRPATLPPECLRVYWLDYGGPTRQVNETRSLVQLDVFVEGRNVATALGRASALEQALGFTQGVGSGRLGIFASSEQVGEARLVPLESGWVEVKDPTPGVIHLARTLFVYSTPTAP